MTPHASTNDFYRIVIDNIPLIDVRAPVEFIAGAFPMAFNQPIMDDEDRHLVGICYKQQGREAAFGLAFKRVSGRKKEERVAAWVEYVKQHPDALCYCFRGGMRSQTAQQWYEEETGQKIQRLEGGYKAFRRYLIEQLDPAKIIGTPVILGGRTGVGKTILLHQLANSIDLEAIANHRGSTFGRHLTPQPSQIDFENRLACAILNHGHSGYSYMVLEDEGSYIGTRYIPKELAHYFNRDSMVLLECDLEYRISLTFEEYVSGAQQEYFACYNKENGLGHWYEDICNSIDRIKKRLGGERLKRVLALISAAHKEQLESGDSSLHRGWVKLLLSEYYDPMYDYQIEKSNRTIQFRGNTEEVLQYLRTLETKRI